MSLPVAPASSRPAGLEASWCPRVGSPVPSALRALSSMAGKRPRLEGKIHGKIHGKSRITIGFDGNRIYEWGICFSHVWDFFVRDTKGINPLHFMGTSWGKSRGYSGN